MTDTEKDQIVAVLYLDLVQVQKEIETVDKDGKNPFFNSGYATLGATITACKDILNKHNFIVLQPIQSDEFGVYVCTTLIHSTGGKIESKMRINQKEQNNPQAQGSAITYARRYSLQSLLCMNAEDDDGNVATGTNKTVKVLDKKFEETVNQDRCSICHTTNQYHAPSCPNKNDKQ